MGMFFCILLSWGFGFGFWFWINWRVGQVGVRFSSLDWIGLDWIYGNSLAKEVLIWRIYFFNFFLVLLFLSFCLDPLVCNVDR
ncbi:hypothetical protein QBC46DRAFT_386871, partial [Diplogelasinospora grovesii]